MVYFFSLIGENLQISESEEEPEVARWLNMLPYRPLSIYHVLLEMAEIVLKLYPHPSYKLDKILENTSSTVK